MFPMKFFEYLSAGLQVVSTDLSSLDEYSNISYISKNEAEFENSLYEILENFQRQDEQEIISECLKHTWDNRYYEMMRIIDKTL